MEGRQKDMGKLEIKKGKHKHILTDILKFSIFGVIMLAPFFSILSRCLYITFNKNAKDSYYGETINQYEYNNVNQIVVDESYTFINFNNLSTTISSTTVYVENVHNVFSENTGLTNILNNLVFIRIYYDTDLKFQLNFDNNGVNTNNYYLANQYAFQFDFTLSNYLNVYTDILPYIKSKSYNEYSYLDNAFIYSVNELHNQQIFNWTENTAIYTAINTMTTGLGFNNNNNTLALLLTYWALNTAVYIIFDIVIWAFTKLTHIMQE